MFHLRYHRSDIDLPNRCVKLVIQIIHITQCPNVIEHAAFRQESPIASPKWMSALKTISLETHLPSPYPIVALQQIAQFPPSLSTAFWHRPTLVVPMEYIRLFSTSITLIVECKILRRFRPISVSKFPWWLWRSEMLIHFIQASSSISAIASILGRLLQSDGSKALPRSRENLSSCTWLPSNLRLSDTARIWFSNG